MTKDEHDPKGLIAAAYAMEGVGAPEARSIFLDWALSVEDPLASLPVLLARHDAPDHPMTAVLRAGQGTAQPRRRGGPAGRRS